MPVATIPDQSMLPRSQRPIEQRADQPATRIEDPELYVPRARQIEADQCPVARVVGTSQNDCADRLDTERYNAVFADPPGIGEGRSHRARYIRGCTPGGKEALPQ